MARTTSRKRKTTTRVKSRAKGPIDQPEANSTAQHVAETEAGKPGADAEEASRPAVSHEPLKKTRKGQSRRSEATESDLVERHSVETKPEDVQVEDGKPEVLIESKNAPEELTQEEVPLRGRTLIQVCMDAPSFRSKVISRLIRKLR